MLPSHHQKIILKYKLMETIQQWLLVLYIKCRKMAKNSFIDSTIVNQSLGISLTNSLLGICSANQLFTMHHAAFKKLSSERFV